MPWRRCDVAAPKVDVLARKLSASRRSSSWRFAELRAFSCAGD